MKKKSKFLAGLSAIGFATSLVACAPMVSTHGNLLKEDNIAEITPMVSTRADVLDKWGPPTSVSTFDPNVWYYIGETRLKRSILEHKVEERQVIKIVFADDDSVVEAAFLDPAAGLDIEPVERRTPTAGKEFTAFQQFVSNLGKFNTDQKKGRQ